MLLFVVSLNLALGLYTVPAAEGQCFEILSNGILTVPAGETFGTDTVVTTRSASTAGSTSIRAFVAQVNLTLAAVVPIAAIAGVLVRITAAARGSCIIAQITKVPVAVQTGVMVGTNAIKVSWAPIAGCSASVIAKLVAQINIATLSCPTVL